MIVKKSTLQRIALVVPRFPNLSETFIVNKFKGLIDKGYDIQIICRASEPYEWASYPHLASEPAYKNRVHVNFVTRPRWLVPLLLPYVILRSFLLSFKATWNYLRRGWRKFGIAVLKHLYLDAQLVATAPDIIHFEFGALAVGRTHLKDLLDCKIAVSFRGYDLNYIGLDRNNHYQKVWEQADRLHLLGHDLWQRAIKRGCPPDKPHTLIPPALDVGFFEPARPGFARTSEAAQKPLRILSVGRLEWEKGYEFALQAINLIREHGISLEYRIIGDGSHWSAIVFCRHQLDLEDTVELLGSIPQADVVKEMQAADIFLHAAVSEGFCNAAIEAQALKLPIVTSDAGGLPENVEDSITGFVVPRRNPEALAEKVIELANDPELRKQMGEAGRQRVLEHFRIEQQIEAFDSFYQELATS